MTNEEQVKTMTPEQKAKYELILKATPYNSRNTWAESVLPALHTVYNQQQAEIDRLQAKITQFAGMLLHYETKFDLIAENEAKRCIGFGITVRNECAKWAFVRVGDNSDTITYTDKMEFAMHSINGQIVYPDTSAIESMNIKQLYTNFKKG